MIGAVDTDTNDSTFSIGRDCRINGLFCIMLDDDSHVSIGNDCLFSDAIELWASDTHTIFNSKREVLNRGKNITIGKHVWIGKHVKILKNAQIPDESIVGMMSLVCKKFTNSHIAIAGNPAKIIKENINWDSARPNKFQ
ncbi:MAG: hypothetical protein IKV03_00430 [Alphaproteobacteria bacterium]|nr:hypothetical protein [Alphaproteobacteria bacterium]